MPNAVPVAFAAATSPQATSSLDTNFNYLAQVVLDNLVALRATTPKTSGPVRVFLAGYGAVGTGGSGWYWYNPADTTSADNGLSIIVAVDGGRWYLQAINSIGGATIGGVTIDAQGRLVMTTTGVTAVMSIKGPSTAGQLSVGGTSIGVLDALLAINGSGSLSLTNNVTATGLIMGATGITSVSTLRGVLIPTPTVSGDTITVGPSNTTGALIATNAALTDGAGASAGTLTNAPSAGNPTKWIKVNDNGVIRSVPAW